ncbi:lipase family alpha/beta hydrolase [Leptospira sp. 'Mane']|uniref:lipase family alpha/beta hydrolase n=1 Tax=Leptospira sp. 'Mane' TaxID=3387407 RepID=UPI00398B3150
MFLKRSIFLICSLCFLNQCIYDFYKKEFETDKDSNRLFILAALGLIPNPNHKLFQFFPATSRNLKNEQFVDAYFSDKNSGRTKILFIHGWNPAERDSDPVPGDSKKIDNIKNTFGNGIIHYQENRNSAKDKYELFLYTYRTSSGVVFNGQNFAVILKNTFKKEDKVIVVAHSMGGIVTRSAMLSSDYIPGLIDGVVTLASPLYGSPFATSNFSDNPLLKEMVSYLTGTVGGRDLRHTNNGNGQTAIVGSENDTLDFINKNLTDNSKFISYYGVLSGCSGNETFYYASGCQILSSANAGFASNDGIVPANSAILGGLTPKQFMFTGYDHSMMAFQTIDVTDVKSLSLFQSVIGSIDELLSLP